MIVYVDAKGKEWPAEIVGEPKQYSADFFRNNAWKTEVRPAVDLNVNFGTKEHSRWSPIINARKYEHLFNTFETPYYKDVDDKPKSAEKGK
jgi:hypothetical protein